MMDAIIRWLSEKGGEHVIEFIKEQAKSLADARGEASIARQDRDEALKAAAKAKGELRSALDSAAALKPQLDAAQEQMAGAMSYRVKLEARINDLEKANDQLQAERDDMEGTLRQSEQANASLLESLDAEKARVSDHKARLVAIADFVKTKQ
jgi:chromosome segregation ATPase